MSDDIAATRPLVTIRPGPVLCVWSGNAEPVQVPLTIPAALHLVACLVTAIRRAAQ